jgi:phage tail sheath gpL-like
MFRYSTGAVEKMAGHQTVKEMFNDGVLVIYSGAQPATADTAYNGIELCRLAYGGTFVAGTKSTRQVSTVTCTAGTAADKYIVVINGTAYEYDMGSGDTATIIATALAALIDADDAVTAVNTAGVIVVRARFGGVAFTIANTGSTQPANVVIATPTANSRAAGIQFGAATAGVLAQESNPWTGTATADGTAAWFRIYANAVDAGGASTTLPRIDGNISTTSGDMILRTLNIITGDPLSISGSSITFPTVRT